MVFCLFFNLYLNRFGNDVEVDLLKKNERTKIISFITRENKPVEIEIGIKMPKEKYRILILGFNGEKKGYLDNEIVNATALKKSARCC